MPSADREKSGFARAAEALAWLKAHAAELSPRQAAEARALAQDVLSALPDAEHRIRVTARTFGNFDLLADGRPVIFRQARCKELLAYLIDRQGGCVTRAEAFAVLWEDRMYDRPMQKQLDVIIRSMRATLEEQGIGGIFELDRGTMRVVPERIDCDAWRYFRGDPEAIRAYRGEYMSAYSWASLKEASLDPEADP